MRVLVGCECTQAVTIALRENGVEAFSCDILPCTGWRHSWHIQGNLQSVLSYGWDALIAFPPCTHLSSSGAAHFEKKKKLGLQQKAIDFFLMCAEYPAKFKCVENPIGIMSTIYRKPDQIIQPWQFGHGVTKSTCLWLTGLPLLVPTKIVTGRVPIIHKMGPGPNRAFLRSRTFPGIADAMGIQWGTFLKQNGF